MEASKPLHAGETGMEREWSFPSISWLNDELLGQDKGDFIANLAYLAEGFCKLQFLEYILTSIFSGLMTSEKTT